MQEVAQSPFALTLTSVNTTLTSKKTEALKPLARVECTLKSSEGLEWQRVHKRQGGTESTP